MGLFNSGKNQKIDKVEKHERIYNVPPPPANRQKSKHHSNHVKPIIRPMPQPLSMAMGPNYFQSPPIFNSNAMSQLKYGYPPISPYDLSKYPSPSVNPFLLGQMAPMNMSPLWSNGFNSRLPFQQKGLNDYQQGGWPLISPSNNGYMPPMQF